MTFGVVLWFGLAVAIGYQATQKGRNGLAWFLLSLLVSPILGILFLLLAEELDSGRTQGVRTAASQRASEPLRPAVLVGDGAFRFPVVGESFYLHEIESIVGHRSEEGFHGRRLDVVVVPEPDNPYDPHAVAVKVGGVTVGHLARDVAPLFQDALAAGGFNSAAAEAKVNGGWDRGPHDKGEFGIRLNARLPFVLRPASGPVDVFGEAGVSASPRRRRAGLRALGLAGSVVALIAIVCVGAILIAANKPSGIAQVTSNVAPSTVAPTSVSAPAESSAITAPTKPKSTKAKTAVGAPLNLVPISP